MASSGLSTRVTLEADGTYVVRFATNTRKFYTVEYCDSLSTGQWIALAPELAGTGSEMAIADNTPDEASKRFYHVKVR